MSLSLTRRDLALAAAGLPLLSSCLATEGREDDPPFRISLAQWSLHRTIRSGDLDPLDFPEHAALVYDVDAVEYVNQFFADKAIDPVWMNELRQRSLDAGVRNLLIMIDGEGSLAAADDDERARAIQDHTQWLGAAAVLGCHSIRVNAAGNGERDEVAKRAADSLVQIAERATPYDLSIIVENHGGLSSDGSWLADVMRRADHPRVGTLPDFGNFHLGGDEWYDRYLGVEEMMPWAKAVSAKSHDFDAEGEEAHTDYARMLRIVLEAGYGGYVGIEYEGSSLSERDGILATKRLLVRLQRDFAGGAA